MHKFIYSLDDNPHHVTVIHHRDVHHLMELPQKEDVADNFSAKARSQGRRWKGNGLKNPFRIVSCVSFDEIRKSGHRTYKERRYRPG